MITNLLHEFLEAIRKENPGIPDEDFDKIERQVQEKATNEPAPRIAVIGESGVGKSTTLNVLFNAGHEVGHIEATTQIEKPIEAEFARGKLIVYDMPGLGESLKKREVHLATYRRILENVDVALWILDAQYRAIESVQRYLTDDLRLINRNILDRMVFALNKVDIVHPGNWDKYANLPSEEQKVVIEGRIRNVQEKIREAVPSWRGSVIGYSALRYYNLPVLFLGMLDAAPRKRKWVLDNVKEIADYLEQVDERFRPLVLQASKTPEEQVAELLQSMSEEERARLLKSNESVGSFISRFLRRK